MLVLKDLDLEPSKISWVPNGVDIDKFSNPRHASGVLQKYGLPSTGPLVLCVCRISRNKGLHYLLQATSKLKTMIGTLSVLIVGPSRDKEYKNWLVNMAINLGVADVVHFRENVPDDDLTRLYSQADLFVLPSEQETLPLVVLEAMAAGCPLIATSVGGIPDIVVNGENGLLIDPGNAEEIVEGVSMLLNDDNLRMKLSEQGRRTARDYSWKNIALRTVDVYSKSLSRLKGTART
jgi:glycosyltransferase involved in cell wall biosynthesis